MCGVNKKKKKTNMVQIHHENSVREKKCGPMVQKHGLSLTLGRPSHTIAVAELFQLGKSMY